MSTHQKKHIKNKNKVKEFITRDYNNGEEYGQVLKVKGDARFEIRLDSNNSIITAKAPGRLQKGPHKQIILVGDIVLLQSNNDNIDDKYYILYKFSHDEVKGLIKSGEISKPNNNVIQTIINTTTSTTITSTQTDSNADEDINFDDL